MVARLALLFVLLGATAHAENITVGVFAPSAPFPSTAARVELASRLGEHVGKALGGTGTGRVYARAGDFATAVRGGTVTIALVDATYLAGANLGQYTVIAGSVRNGAIASNWQLVARGGGKIDGLKGKRILVPSNGGRETELLLNVMLGGDVAKDFFAKIEAAPDTASTLASLNLGKADAAIVPTGVDLPGGVAVVLAMPSIAHPVLVAFKADATQKTALTTAAGTFKGDGTINGFRATDGRELRAVAGRFVIPAKRGQMAVPTARVVVGDLVEGRTWSLDRAPATTFVQPPK
jgi:hypothetical protein